MYTRLNTEQAKGLSRFFFDIAKGLVLGEIGLFTIGSVEAKAVAIFLISFLAFACIKLALWILEEIS